MPQETTTREAGPVERAVGAEEWRARVELAALHRLVALRGWDDLIFTHISARVPGQRDRFLVTPFGLQFEEVTASSVVEVDHEGHGVAESGHDVNPAGFVIHSALHSARGDIDWVIHLHTPHGQAVAGQREGLLPATQTAMAIVGHVAYHDYEGILTSPEEGARLVADLGDKRAMILRNHGTLAVAKTAGEAWLNIYFLERACEAQILALSAGRDAVQASAPEAAQRTHVEALAFVERGAPELVWAAQLRMLDRADPGYRE